MPDRKMPNSNYDTDIRAYGVIWERTVRFHTNLKGKAEDLARHDEKIEVKHVDQAYKQVIRSEAKLSIGEFFGELVVAFGGVLIAPLLNEIGIWLQNGTSPNLLSILIAIIGLLIVIGKIIIVG